MAGEIRDRTQYSDRVDCRRGDRRSALHAGERGRAVRDAGDGDRCFAATRVRCRRVGAGRAGRSIVSAGMALSMLVTLNGTTMSGARVPFAAARDGYFFPAVAKVHPAISHAFVAILVQAGLAVVAVAGGGKVSSAVFAGDFRGMAFLHDCRQHDFRVSDGANRMPTVLTGSGDILLFRRCLFSHLRFLLYYTFTDNLTEFSRGMPGDSGRRTCFLLFSPALRRAIAGKPTSDFPFGTGSVLSIQLRLPRYTSGRHVYPSSHFPYLKASTRALSPARVPHIGDIAWPRLIADHSSAFLPNETDQLADPCHQLWHRTGFSFCCS